MPRSPCARLARQSSAGGASLGTAASSSRVRAVCGSLQCPVGIAAEMIVVPVRQFFGAR
jgi:hypothetical protein